MTSPQRSYIMSHIRSRNTKPEMIVRRYLWREGFRYRLNDRRLPGHPDMVLRKYRTCIFVNGCFCHGHEGCKYSHIPKTNVEFWSKKIYRNKERDKLEQKQLAKMGWHSITVWECQLKPKERESTLKSLAFTLNRLFLRDHSVTYSLPEEDTDSSLAAEDLEINKR